MSSLTVNVGATTSFVVWTAAEIFVTLICTGIPVLWPLVHHWSPRFASYSKSVSKGNRGKEREGAVFGESSVPSPPCCLALREAATSCVCLPPLDLGCRKGEKISADACPPAMHTIGGSAMPPPGYNDGAVSPMSPAYLGPRSSRTVTRVTSYPYPGGSDGGSEEGMLQAGGVEGGSVARNSNKIVVRDEVSVEYASDSEGRPQ